MTTQVTKRQVEHLPATQVNTLIAQPSEHTAKVVKRPLVCFQESLLCGVIVGHVKRSAARHGAHREVVNRLSLAPDLSHGFIPIHLRLAAPVVDLGHERFPRDETQLLLALLHVAAHGRFCHRRLGPFLAYPFPDAVCRVPLLARRLLIQVQNLVDELPHRTESWPSPYRRLALRRNRASPCLP